MGFACLVWFVCTIVVLPQHAVGQVDDPPLKDADPLIAAADERVNRIQSLLEQGQTDQALVMLENFVESGSSSPRADAFTFLHARALQAKGDTKQAIIILEQFLEEYPVSSHTDEARLSLGTLYLESKQAHRAITVLTHALNRSFNPSTQTKGLHLLHQAYELKGEHNKAVHMAMKQLKATTED